MQCFGAIPWYDICRSLLDDDEQPVVGVDGGLQLQLVELETDLGPEVDVSVAVGDDNPHAILHGFVEARIVVFISPSPVNKQDLSWSNPLVGGKLLKCFVWTARSVVHEDGGYGGGDEGGDLVEEEAVLHRPGDVQGLACRGQDIIAHLYQIQLIKN